MSNLDLEARMFEDFRRLGDIPESDIERWLLIVSGRETEEEITEYTQKLDIMQKEFEKYYEAKTKNNNENPELKKKETEEEIELTKSLIEITEQELKENNNTTIKTKFKEEQTTLKKELDNLEKELNTIKETEQYNKAELLHDFLFEEKEDRYNSNFLLKDVIDAQINYTPEKKVGNCVGLSSLYVVLGIRNKLNLVTFNSTYHVSIGLKINQKNYEIECTNKNGFNIQITIHGDAELKEEPIKQFISIVYNTFGHIYSDLKLFDKAIPDFTKAIELNPEFSVAYCGRGNVYFDLKVFDEAIKDYIKAIKFAPEFLEAIFSLGMAYRKLKVLLVDAIQGYTEAIELNPEDSVAYSNRGEAYCELKDFDRAIEDCSVAIELDSKNSDAYKNRGNTYFELKKFTEARNDYKKAIELNPKFKDKLTLNIKEIEKIQSSTN